jgi:hypothetical protein
MAKNMTRNLSFTFERKLTIRGGGTLMLPTIRRKVVWE